MQTLAFARPGARTQRPVRPALALALAASVGLSALAQSQPALAQLSAAAPVRTIETTRLIGGYHTSGESLRIAGRPDGAFAVSGRVNFGAASGLLHRRPDGALAGLIAITRYERGLPRALNRQEFRAVIRPTETGLTLALEPADLPPRAPGEPPIPGSEPVRFEADPRPLNAGPWDEMAGRWRGASGLYDLNVSGRHLTGRLTREIEGVPEVVRQFLFADGDDASGAAPFVGAWGDPRAGLDGDAASLQWSQDRSRLYLRWTSGLTEHREVLSREDAPTTGEQPRDEPSAPAPAPRPVPRPDPETPQPPAADDFQPLGAWSVRVDRVENPREDRLVHVYLTLRNDSTRPLLQTQDVSVLHQDSTGIMVESGQGLKALPGYPELFGSPPPVVLPGNEIRTKFVFDRNRGASTTLIIVQEGRDHTAEFEF